MRINSNIAALHSVRQINKTNDKISSALEKLSSGYKINKVSDDPTGTAVSSKVKAQLYGLKIASKNAADGISLVQTAEGAMAETHEMLKRMRELSVQAANGTNTPEDRQKIQLEIDGLINAIDQMSEITEFNQKKLLNGSLSNLTTVWEDGTNNLSHDLKVNYMSPSFPTGEYQIEILAADTNTTVEGTYTKGASGEIKINGETVSIGADDSDEEIQNKLTELAGRFNCVVEFPSDGSFSLVAKESGDGVKLNMSGSSVTVTSYEVGKDAEVALSDGFSKAAIVKTDGNRIFITETDGAELTIDINTFGATGTYNIKIEDKGQLKLQVGANEDQLVALMVPGISSASLGLTKKTFVDTGGTSSDNTVSLVNVKNTADAESSIALLDTAISKVSNMRAELGAYQNRLEHTVNSLDINYTNTAEALSRLQDTDMALEMSNYTLNNVILQSGISMLSQANQMPQQMLQLLR